MKKILFIGTAVAIAMGFSSCQKENITEEQASGRLIRETFSADFERTVTKTTISDDAATVSWAANDTIYYYSSDGGAVRSFTIPAAGESAALTLERGEGDTYYNLVYAGNAEPAFTTRTDALMVFDGVKSEQDGTFQSANISVGHTTPGGSGITFKPVTALVKFTTARTDIKTIVLTGGNGEKVAGNISVDPTASSPVATLSGTGENSITVTIATPAPGTYYINVLPDTYDQGLKLTLRNTSGAEIGTVTASNSTDLSAVGSMINYGNVDSHIVEAPSVLLPGKFSVSANDKVQFSKGNLYCKRSSSSSNDWTWGFYANQYDYNSLNTSASRTAASTDTEKDHFVWGSQSTDPTDTQSAASSSTTDIQGTSEDWGVALASSLPTVTGGWKTLKSSEWTYLLNTEGAASGARTDANRFARARVNNVKGLIIFPDGYNGGTKITDGSIVGVAKVNDREIEYPVNSIEAATWSTMESAGCVFLPAAGYRNGSSVLSAGSYGYYWSSTSCGGDEPLPYYLQIITDWVDPKAKNSLTEGYSVRLVCAAQ